MKIKKELLQAFLDKYGITTKILARDMGVAVSEVEKLYRLMCFNVFAHNRDDHSKNFTYLYEEKEARWVLSPAYDLTFRHSIGGEHATTIHGNGKNPDIQECVLAAETIGMDSRKAKRIAGEVKERVNSRLRKYINRESR